MATMRTFVVTKLSEFIEQKYASNIEKSIFNWSIKNSKNNKEPPAWENKFFKETYKRKYMNILATFRYKDSFLADRILSGEVKTKEIASLSPEKLHPNGLYAKTIEEQKVKFLKKELAADKSNNYTGIFTCGRCKSKKTTYYQMQTRSADDPMTTFVTCLNCNKKWKF